ncbi:hypothetical protein [Ponticaulis sp.]|uniref:hypothetical protein n=1 Tax=Ponticaulis sp. TaxID=2020902 RepID=UPI0025DFCF11|nr:hypothetical protein [Ponticaulis sp.]|tara:strand:- start:339417 stop:339932 length:516 start_codon:yes stop_codon:yes gene_type:complete
MKLAIEPVPAPLWNFNLREFMPESGWDKFHRSLFNFNDLSCAVCRKKVDQPSSLHVDEVWSYDCRGRRGVARLEKVRLCCWHCKKGKNLDRSEHGHRTKSRILPDAVDHFCRINSMSRQAMMLHMKRAFNVWEDRNKLEWKVDWGSYSKLLHVYYEELPSPCWFTPTAELV